MVQSKSKRNLMITLFTFKFENERDTSSQNQFVRYCEMPNDINDIEPVVALKFEIETYIQVCLINLKLKNLSVSHSESEV